MADSRGPKTIFGMDRMTSDTIYQACRHMTENSRSFSGASGPKDYASVTPPKDAIEELAKFEQSLKAATHRRKGGSIGVTKNAYHDLMRGRYTYLNEFMDDMQKEPELDREMTKMQKLRQQRSFELQASSTKYIVAAFAGGTALCVVRGVALHKYSMDVSDGKEYAEKMRERTPSTKDALDRGTIGIMMRDFKYRFSTWIGRQSSFQHLTDSMQTSFGEMQEVIRRRPSGSQPTLAPLTRHLSGKVPNAGESFA
eukprot:CAMPEP_0181300720 /NCGR_PEP_ID=MMETSP1101-20121128/7040_1 /TAXON_ID=46948 /ORGANISM="Rhodomonas abbreviata, Strain Caron Lab Isolate" /LENGTH=253 /DNA_ID=CAMNT_0023405975 /DNA_START=42 /DNA_END=801 /DNA_ORIENTATION=-